jgi:hypothetical protein
LLRRNKECNCVNETEQPQNDKSCQPIGIAASDNLLKEIIAIIHRRTARLTNKPQCLDVRSATIFSKHGSSLSLIVVPL